ncbi:uncharacterized protein LOC125379185 [Haliotis rufescens]|uniref:uncharacterized protein LOC125379185 n=1 Tax=Haliotis rufescens TaxID=6454 RepID=UPI00201F9987|nr:uncharacterized protein LOC125379185 [Haliotis rufescens]
MPFSPLQVPAATEELQCPNGSFLLAQLAYGTNIRRRSCHTNHVTNKYNERKVSVSESLKPGEKVTFTLTTTSSSTWFGITVENPEIASLDISVGETDEGIPLQCMDYSSSKGRTGSDWNTAERCPNLANRTFTLEVVLGENDFQVSVDGNVLFNHEVPKEFQTETMNTLTVTGDVQIKSIYIN